MESTCVAFFALFYLFHLWKFHSGESKSHSKHNNSYECVGQGNLCAAAGLNIVVKEEESTKKHTHDAAKSVERLSQIESSCRGARVAKQRHIGVSCRFEHHQSAANHEKRQQKQLKLHHIAHRNE